MMAENRSSNTEQEAPLGDLVPIKVAAGEKISASHLRLLLRTGQVEGIKIGRDWFTTHEAVDEYLAQDRKPGPKPKDGQE